MECHEHISLNLKFLRSNKSNEVVFFTYLRNSPDLNLVDYSISRLTQECDYQAEMRDISDLKQCLCLSARAELKQTIINKAPDQWQTKLRASIHAKGQHFEHLFNWLIVFGQNCMLSKYTAYFTVNVTFSYVDAYCAHIPLFPWDVAPDRWYLARLVNEFLYHIKVTTFIYVCKKHTDI